MTFHKTNFNYGWSHLLRYEAPLLTHPLWTFYKTPLKIKPLYKGIFPQKCVLMGSWYEGLNKLFQPIKEHRNKTKFVVPSFSHQKLRLLPNYGLTTGYYQHVLLLWRIIVIVRLCFSMYKIVVSWSVTDLLIALLISDSILLHEP